MNDFEKLFNEGSHQENNQGDSIPDTQSATEWEQAFDYGAYVPTQKEQWQILREREERERLPQQEMEQFRDNFMEGIKKKGTNASY